MTKKDTTDLGDEPTKPLQEFISRATRTRHMPHPEDPSKQISSEDATEKLVKSILGKQQMFGQIDLDNRDPFDLSNTKPTMLENVLIDRQFNHCLSQLAMLIDLFHVFPDGDISEAFASGQDVQVKATLSDGEKELEGEVDSVLQFNILETILMKLVVGSYIMDLHNVYTSPSAKDDLRSSLIKELNDKAGTDADILKFSKEADHLLRDLQEAGGTKFVDGPKTLQKLCENHHNGVEDVYDALCKIDIPDMDSVDRDILANKVAPIYREIIKFMAKYKIV
tara:strand:+ start:1171 stop:2010 length:840 start_codon:yes stop_codon:yes gene_type:complete